MSTRVRYKKQDGLLVTSEYLGKEFVVKAEISLETNSYKILTRDNALLQYGAAKTLPAVKRLVKTALKSLGVQFTDEIREERDEDEQVDS